MGIVLNPINQIRQDLADSPAVREVLGITPSGNASADATSALGRIYIDGLPSPVRGTDALTAQELEELRPYIIVYPAEAEAIRIRVASPDGCLDTSGTIMIHLSLPYTETQADDGPTALWQAIAAKVDKVIYNNDQNNPGIIDYIGTPGRVQVYEMQVALFGRTPLEHRMEYGDAYDVVIECQWGTR
jgi:hypothetical protein